MSERYQIVMINLIIKLSHHNTNGEYSFVNVVTLVTSIDRSTDQSINQSINQSTTPSQTPSLRWHYWITSTTCNPGNNISRKCHL